MSHISLNIHSYFKCNCYLFSVVVIEVTVNQSVTVLEGTSYQFCAEFTIEYDFVFNIEVTITDGNTDGKWYYNMYSLMS